jgi:hypothetical protein
LLRPHKQPPAATTAAADATAATAAAIVANPQFIALSDYCTLLLAASNGAPCFTEAHAVAWMLKMRVAGSVAEALALGTRLLEYDLIFAAGDMTGHKLGSAAAAAAAAASSSSAASSSTAAAFSSAAAKSGSVSASGESPTAYCKYLHFAAFCCGAGVATAFNRYCCC